MTSLNPAYSAAVNDLVNIHIVDLRELVGMKLDLPHVTSYEMAKVMSREFAQYNSSASVYRELLVSLEQHLLATTSWTRQVCAREAALAVLAIAYHALVACSYDDLAATLRSAQLGKGHAQAEEDEDDAPARQLQEILQICQAAPRGDLADTDARRLGDLLVGVLGRENCEAQAWATTAAGRFLGTLFAVAIESTSKKKGDGDSGGGDGGGSDGDGDGDDDRGGGDDDDGEGGGGGGGDDDDGEGGGGDGDAPPPPLLFAMAVELRRALTKPRLARLGTARVAPDVVAAIDEARRRVQAREPAPGWPFDDEDDDDDDDEEGAPRVAHRACAPVRVTPHYRAGAAIPLQRRAFLSLPSVLVRSLRAAESVAQSVAGTAAGQRVQEEIIAAKAEARRVWGLNLDVPLLTKTAFRDWGMLKRTKFGAHEDDYNHQASFIRGAFGNTQDLFSLSAGKICAAYVSCGVGWAAVPVLNAQLSTKLVRNTAQRIDVRTKSATLITELLTLFKTGVSSNSMKTSKILGKQTALRMCYYAHDRIEVPSGVKFLSTGSTLLTHVLNHGRDVNLFDDANYVAVGVDTGMHQVVTAAASMARSGTNLKQPCRPAEFKQVYTLHRGRLLDDGGAGRFHAARAKLYEDTGVGHWQALERTVLPFHGMTSAPAIDGLVDNEECIAHLRNCIKLPIFLVQNSHAYQVLKRLWRERRRSAIDGAARDFVRAVLREETGRGDRSRTKVFVAWGNAVFSSTAAGSSYHEKFLEALLRLDNVLVVQASEHGSSRYCVHCGDGICEAHHPKQRKRKRGGGVFSGVLRGLSVGDCCGHEYARDGDAAAAIVLNVAHVLKAGSPLAFATPRGSMATAKGQRAWLKHYTADISKRVTASKATLQSDDARRIQAAVNAQIEHAAKNARAAKAAPPLSTADATDGPDAKALAASASAIRHLRVVAQLLALQLHGVAATDKDDVAAHRAPFPKQAPRARGNA